MKKNVAGQHVSVVLKNTSDGTDFTGTAIVSVDKNGAGDVASAGTVAYVANGRHRYTPTQAETNADNIVFTFSAAGVLSASAQIYTGFPQTVDNDVLAAGASGFVATKAVVDGVLVDTAEIGTAGAGLTNINLPNQTIDITGNITGSLSGSVGSVTGGATSAALVTVQNDLDVITGVDGVNLLSGTQASITSIEGKTNPLTFTVAGQVDANPLSISGSSTAADNLELQFDGVTGLTGDLFPATQAGISGIGSGSSGAVHIEATEDNTSGAIIDGIVSVGTPTGTFSNTDAEDGVLLSIVDVANDIDWVLGYDVGGTRAAVSVEAVVNVDGNADNITMKAYDHVGVKWDIISTIPGTGGIAFTRIDAALLARHTGTGAELGKVYIRFDTDATTPSLLEIDLCILGAVSTSQSIGYANGSIWIDTVNGTAGATPFLNGTADKPVLTLADAIILSSSVGLKRFHIANGSSITFAETHDTESWVGTNWNLALGGQNISGTFIQGAALSGTATGANSPHIEHCEIGAVTLPPCRINGSSGFTNTLTLGSAGSFDIVGCNSLVAGGGSPTIDMGVGGSCSVSVRGWSGGLKFINVAAGDVASLEGTGGTISVNGTGGEIHIRGIWEDVSDLSSAAVTLVQTAALNRKSLAGYEDSSVWLDTNASNTNTIDYVDGTSDNPVSSIAAASTIATSLGLRSIHSLRGSVFTLAQSYIAYGFDGGGASIALGGQDIGGSVILEALVSGIATGSFQVIYDSCKLTNVTTPIAGLLNCSVSGTLTLGAAGKYTINNCYDSGDTSPAIIDFGAAVGTMHTEIHDWTGGLELQNLGQTGTDTVNLNGSIYSLTINANCIGGTINIAGDVSVNDNSGGAVTINYVDVASDVTAILEDTSTTIPAQITALPNDILTTALAEVYASDGVAPTVQQALMLIQQTIGDFAISGTTMTVKKLDGSTTAATYTLDDAGNPTSRTRTS